MARLKDRNVFPPGGFRYFHPETNWAPTPWASFDSTAQQIIQHRLGNRYLMEKHGWSIDPAAVANELDTYNSRICQEMGWSKWIAEGTVGDAPPSFPQPRSLNRPSAGSVAGQNRLRTGIQTIAEWEIAGGRLVPQELAYARARTCAARPDGAKCPKNGKGDLTRWFTVPAARLIQLQLESRNNMKIHTELDENLGVCEACSCPLKLKVHCPIEIILSKMPPEDKAQLDPGCWILSESK